MATDFSNNPNYKLYSPVADAAASQFAIPADILKWQIGQESSWNPSAVNGQATGIAQFEPATAAQYGVNPSDPVSSIYGAAQYDADLLKKYGGNWNKVFAAYGTTANNGVTPPTFDQNAPNPNNGGLPSWWNQAQVNSQGGGLSTLSYSRIVSIILGLVFIGGALYTLKPVQEIVNTAGAGTLKAIAA